MSDTPASPTITRLPISMRMSEDLVRWLKQQAKKNHRTFASEITHRLTQMQTEEGNANV